MKAMKMRLRWRAAALGTGVGVVSMVSACAAAAGMMAGGAADPALMGYWTAGILVGAGLLGSLTALLGGGSPADAALSAAGELMVLLGLNWALNGAQVEGFAVTCLALAGGSGAAILLTAGKGRSRGHRRRKRKKS